MTQKEMKEKKEEAPPSIAEAVEHFLKDIGRGHSPATQKTYRNVLNGFLRHLEPLPSQASNSPSATNMRSVANLQTDWAVNFLRQRADGASARVSLATAEGIQATGKASKATLATYAAALSRFYKWCGVERLLTLPAEEYERMQIRFKEIKGKERRTILNKVPPDQVVEALIKEVRKPRPAPEISRPRGEVDKVKQELIWLRDIALLETLKCTGARVSELTGLTRGELDNTNQRARAVGKGNKERWLYFSTPAWEALEHYLSARTMALNGSTTAANLEDGSIRATRRSPSGRNYASQPLFARHDRGASLASVKPLTPRAVQRLILSLVERAELDSNITPHKFRHWVATRLLSATGDLAATQDLLGHASPTTTRIYAQVSEQTKQSLHRQVFQ